MSARAYGICHVWQFSFFFVQLNYKLKYFNKHFRFSQTNNHSTVTLLYVLIYTVNLFKHFLYNKVRKQINPINTIEFWPKKEKVIKI